MEPAIFGTVRLLLDYLNRKLAVLEARPCTSIEGVPCKKIVRELWNVNLCLADYSDTKSFIPEKDRAVLDQMVSERLCGSRNNPDSTLAYRPDYYKKLLDKRGKLPYTYPIRLGFGANQVLEQLRLNPGSRQGFLPVYDADDVSETISTVPCTIGYQVRVRGDSLMFTHIMRSCDIARLPVDIYLSSGMAEWFRRNLDLKDSILGFFILSLHKIEEVFEWTQE